MDIPTIIFLAVALAMDAFAVAVTAGFQIKRLTARHVFRLSWHFGLFQALMPVIGWCSGRAVVSYIERYDHWVAFLLLLWIGAGMIRESFDTDEDKPLKDPTRGTRLVLLSVATSIDALAVGFSLAALKVSILLPVIIIGVVALCFTWIGLILGNRFLSSGRVGKKAELLGGAILIFIGIRILHEHNVF
ncbi:MAG: manganese efflux pump [Desulfobacteraceae bacterium]|nr:manganese efflux pump [Desulfobacteraceae bacterium]